jgi:hypothetical protein
MTKTNKPNVLFWIIGVMSLLWNGMGVNAYLQYAFKTEASIAELNAEQIALMEGMPMWYTALFALAIFAGLIGAVILLLRKKMAISFFIVSFMCATINQVYWLFGTDSIEVFSDDKPFLFPVLIVVIAAFLIWYSKNQIAKSVLS